jgi:hypothetical protein
MLVPLARHKLLEHFATGLCGLFLAAATGCGGGGGDSPTHAAARSATEPSPQATAEVARVLLEGAALNATELSQAAHTKALVSATATPQPASTKASARVAVYRFYNRQSGAHFYTHSTTERDQVQAQLPHFSLEGTAFYASSGAAPGLSPVYRFFNTQTGVHFYTISIEERDLIQAQLPQFQFEGVAYHASKVPGAGLKPLYRSFLAHPGVHFYSTRSDETAGLPQYRFEGLAYYVLDGDPQTVTQAHGADLTTVFANPERGFYHSNGGCNFAPATLAQYRSEHISLVLCELDLGSFINTDIDAATLTALHNQFAIFRAAGVKAIFRAAYTWVDGNITPRDATKARILQHIAQLAPIWTANADVIATVQAGFIGTWGEWYYTDHFGNQGVISDAQWADRQEIVTALLQALPAERTVQLRTPAFKQHFYGSGALTAAEAFNGSARARVGHHNDCFLASETDFGTYANPTADKAYLAQDNLYLPQGGETCAVSAYAAWTNAELDLRRLRYAYLNIDYHRGVLSAWGSHLEDARRSLGYRLMLGASTLPIEAASGGTMGIELSLINAGYAAPYNPRKAQLVLRNTTTHAQFRLALAADPRTWAPGTTSTIRETLSLAGVPPGTYALSLNLPDPMPALAERPAYAIRLANTPSPWDGNTGFNALNHTLRVR